MYNEFAKLTLERLIEYYFNKFGGEKEIEGSFEGVHNTKAMFLSMLEYLY